MNNGKPSPEILTAQEVAARLKVKPSWVYANADAPGAYRLGKYLRFSWENVLQNLEESVGVSTQRPPVSG